ncbi:hypothetical protein P4O66_000846 [Electrophorus voltai]|uniref:E3 ubiquitin-protein ligase TRIM32 n=1 Tax=Electrophorus voltai TaxID=2609070 RepID=A0AAD9DYE6_9TELE|nr:hypothetical protein P4O66_000846 [Electrophorus voltai]
MICLWTLFEDKGIGPPLSSRVPVCTMRSSGLVPAAVPPPRWAGAWLSLAEAGQRGERGRMVPERGVGPAGLGVWVVTFTTTVHFAQARGRDGEPQTSKGQRCVGPQALLCTPFPSQQLQPTGGGAGDLTEQALCNLASSEMELRQLQEQQVAEAQAVARGVERALLGAQREERRLVERVGQDHRDLQCRLEQVRRDNAAAVRVGQALVEKRLHKIAQLREQIKKTNERNAEGSKNRDEVGPTRDFLLRGVAELLHPWEISLALKRVSFKPSAQPNAVTFGEIKVQDHSLDFPIGGCGPQGQLCSIHASREQCKNRADSGEGRSTPDGAGLGQDQSFSSLNSCGSQRIVRKIRLSTRSDEESGEEVKPSSPLMRCWTPKQIPSEHDSSQEEECESPISESKGDELFLAVPALLCNGESEVEDFVYRRNGQTHLLASHGARKPRDLSPSPERSYQHQRSQFTHSFDYDDSKAVVDRNQQKSFRGASRFRYGRLASPQSLKDTLSSHSCQDLLSHDRPYLSTSSNDHACHRAPSPAESVDSGYTFIVSSPRNYTTQKSRLSRSSADLFHFSQPFVTEKQQPSMWRAYRDQKSSLSSSSPQRNHPASRTLSCPSPGNHSLKDIHQQSKHPWGVSRSVSMSFIDGSSQDRPSHHTGASQKPKDGVKFWGEKNEAILPELEEDSEQLAPVQVRLVRQFGKQGSGRADLTLPSGIHATSQGQLFLVDCGNARVQVTDQCGNVLQQVAAQNNEQGGSLRRCRNYFDVAVNTKGLIALSCAAERALHIFNRHGRLLQTYGGAPSIAGLPRDELEAPRGVTVTLKDEFLVTDIRKGTLIAMKLEPKTGLRVERTVVTGFHRPYLVTSCLHSGLVAVCERGSETGREACVKVLGPDWNTLRILGVCSAMGPVLTSPWGLCIDKEGAVLVADWAEVRGQSLVGLLGTLSSTVSLHHELHTAFIQTTLSSLSP